MSGDALKTTRTDLGLALLVTLLALLPRAFGLAIFLTADEPKSWFGRSIQFLNALATTDFANTFDSPAPGVTTMWQGTLGLLLDYARQGFPGPLVSYLQAVPFDPLDPTILPLIRLGGILIATLTVGLTYWWGRGVLGRWGAFLAAALLALSPFLLALSRILGHDALVTLFMWLALLTFLVDLRTTRSDRFSVYNLRFTIISGIFGGLAFLTKYPSLSLGAFIAVTMLVIYWRNTSSVGAALKRWAIDIAVWSVAAGLTFVILFPAMWVTPVQTVIAILSDAFRASGSPHQKGSFYFGQPVADPGQSFYLLVTLFKTTPVVWIGWLAAMVAPFHRPFRQKYGRTALILLAFALFYGLLVAVGGKKQDRYILPAFPALLTLAALGYAWLGGWLSQKLSARPVTIGLTAIVVVAQMFFVLPTHPYYFTYYNPLLGGGQAAARLMIIGWGEGMDAAARWLNDQPDGAQLSVVAWYSTTFEPFFEGESIYKVGEEKISRTAKPGLAANYVILYVNQLQRELPSLGALQHFQAVPPAHTVTLNETDYAWVYPSIGLQRVIETDQTRLVGQAELLGFNLLNEAGQPLDALSPTQTTIVELYWEWQGKASDEPLGLSLVDETGRTWGWGNPLGTQARLPFEDWLAGMVAHDDFELTVLPGTPPGDYFLKTWIDRPATGETVGVFPLTHNDGRVTVTRPTQPIDPDTLDIPRLDLPLTTNVTLLGVTDLQSASLWAPNTIREPIFYWQATDVPTASDPVKLTLVDDAGKRWFSWETHPGEPHYRSDGWQPGDLIRAPWSLTLPPNLPPGVYQMQMQWGNGEVFDVATITLDGRPRDFTQPTPAIPLDAEFGSGMALRGLNQLTVDETQARLSLVWEAVATLADDYIVTVQVLDAQNQVIAQRDAAPLTGEAPTTSWTPGEFISDPLTLDLPAAIDPAMHRLLIAVYQPQTGARLLLGDGADHLEIPLD